jgi:sugar phosphate isomerase/epimerase
MEEERFRRLRELHSMFTDADVTPVHENCMNYGGMGWKYTLKLIENVPGLKLVFDTGNPVFTDDRARPQPYPKQSSWDFYSHVKEHVAYVHVKDGIWDNEAKKVEYTMPGDGQGDVRRIMQDLVRRGYGGGISIEPHLSVVFHEGVKQAREDVMFGNYVEYGRRMQKMLAELGAVLR